MWKSRRGAPTNKNKNIPGVQEKVNLKLSGYELHEMLSGS